MLLLFAAVCRLYTCRFFRLQDYSNEQENLNAVIRQQYDKAERFDNILDDAIKIVVLITAIGQLLTTAISFIKTTKSKKDLKPNQGDSPPLSPKWVYKQYIRKEKKCKQLH